MGKYKARGGGSGYWLAAGLLILAVGLIGLTVWLVMKNTPPATCDVSVSSVNVAQTAVGSSYPVTINYSGNGSNACANATVSIAVTLKDSKGNTTTIPPVSYTHLTLPTTSRV